MNIGREARILVGIDRRFVFIEYYIKREIDRDNTGRIVSHFSRSVADHHANIYVLATGKYFDQQCRMRQLERILR